MHLIMIDRRRLLVRRLMREIDDLIPKECPIMTEAVHACLYGHLACLLVPFCKLNFINSITEILF